MSTRLILVRHGQTPWNRDSRYQGWRDTGLTRQGRREVKLLARRMASEPLDAIYSSDLKRACYTARKIAKYHNLRVKATDKLREISFGAWEGLTPDQIEAKWPKLYQRWRAGPANLKIPQGESVEGFAIRVSEAIDDIVAWHPDQTVLVATHGGLIRIAIMKVRGLDLNSWWETRQENGAINILEFHADGATAVLQNDISYLPSSD